MKSRSKKIKKDKPIPKPFLTQLQILQMQTKHRKCESCKCDHVIANANFKSQMRLYLHNCEHRNCDTESLLTLSSSRLHSQIQTLHLQTGHRKCDNSSTSNGQFFQNCLVPSQNSLEPSGTPFNHSNKYIYVKQTCTKAQNTKNNMKTRK